MKHTHGGNRRVYSYKEKVRRAVLLNHHYVTVVKATDASTFSSARDFCGKIWFKTLEASPNAFYCFTKVRAPLPQCPVKCGSEKVGRKSAGLVSLMFKSSYLVKGSWVLHLNRQKRAHQTTGAAICDTILNPKSLKC